MTYSLSPKDVKQVITAILNGKPYDKDQFLYYHLNRNYFNVKNEIKTLRLVTGTKYVDNFGRNWELQSDFKNFFHMPKGNWIGSMVGLSTPYCRKFLLDDIKSGLNGEYEMIIRHDGKRIDALTHENYQETYNFGRTRNTGDHKKLDVDPHRANGGYSFRQNMGSVTVTE